MGEESGWRVRPVKLLGFRHFHNLGPLTDEMRDRPYPDFVQPIYAAIAESYDASLRLPEENKNAFVEIAWAAKVTEAAHLPLLIAALQATGIS